MNQLLYVINSNKSIKELNQLNYKFILMW